MDAVGSAIIDFTEAAYDLAISDEEWLPAVLRRGLPVLDQGLGVAGYEYGRPPDRGDVQIMGVHVASGPEDFAERHLRALATTEPDVLRDQLRPIAATTGSEYARVTNRPQDLEHYLSHVDYGKDVLFLTAVDLKGAGVAIVAPLAEVTKLSRHDAERWQMLTAHVETGHRLRHGLSPRVTAEESATELPLSAEAIFDASSFRLTDAAGRAQEGTATEKLREAAVHVDRARGRLRKDNPDEALQIWKALVRGRWSMVDWFDSDHRRYVLAVPNSPTVNDPRGLTERENQVVSAAVLGHSNKMIAYRLGLSTSRVSTVLRNAMRKLGFRTRTELVRHMVHFQALD
jgi:DNA-binding CsgD family transcriptional regulator